MENQINHFCDEFRIPENRLIGMMNGCLTQIGYNLLYEINQNKKDVACQTMNEPTRILDPKEEYNLKTVNELKVLCKKYGIKNYSRSSKKELIIMILDQLN